MPFQKFRCFWFDENTWGRELFSQGWVFARCANIQNMRLLETKGNKSVPNVNMGSGVMGKVGIVEIKGKIIEILPEKSGQSANGE